MQLSIRIIHTDVAVIGGGGAAARAAYEAARGGAKVCLITKGEFGSGGATAFKVSDLGGFNIPDGAADPADSPERFLEDIRRVSCGMENAELSRTLSLSAVRQKAFLESIGVEFHKEGGGYFITKGCFSSLPRCYTIYGHGHVILEALKKRLEESPGVTVMERCAATRILTDGSRCGGVVALDTERGEAVIIRAGAVVLAAGGAGRLFSRSMNPPDLTGDGNAMAYRAGARIANIEFVQFGVGVLYPRLSSVSYWLFQLRPRFLNGNGEEFLTRRLPERVRYDDVIRDKTHFPFSTRDSARYLETSIHLEITEGAASEHGGVLLDFSHVTPALEASLPDGVRAQWLVTKKWFAERGMDITRQPVEVSDFAHAFNGGVVTDASAQTDIAGLYAAGENACGPHGADRLGGNMLVTCQVFGEIAGQNAARTAMRQSRVPCASDEERELSRLRGMIATGGCIAPERIDRLISKLQLSNWKYLGVLRSGETLKTAYDTVRETASEAAQAKAGNARDLSRLLELKNMLLLTELLIKAADARKESRGPHNRLDHPEMSEEYARVTALKTGSAFPGGLVCE